MTPGGSVNVRPGHPQELGSTQGSGPCANTVAADTLLNPHSISESQFGLLLIVLRPI